MSRNVMYLGMAYDIIAPIILVSNVEKIYTVDYFDDRVICNG